MWPFARRLLTRRELGALGERHAARALAELGRLADADGHGADARALLTRG